MRTVSRNANMNIIRMGRMYQEVMELIGLQLNYILN